MNSAPFPAHPTRHARAHGSASSGRQGMGSRTSSTASVGGARPPMVAATGAFVSQPPIGSLASLQLVGTAFGSSASMVAHPSAHARGVQKVVHGTPSSSPPPSQPPPLSKRLHA